MDLFRPQRETVISHQYFSLCTPDVPVYEFRPLEWPSNCRGAWLPPKQCGGKMATATPRPHAPRCSRSSHSSHTGLLSRRKKHRGLRACGRSSQRSLPPASLTGAAGLPPRAPSERHRPRPPGPPRQDLWGRGAVGQTEGPEGQPRGRQARRWCAPASRRAPSPAGRRLARSPRRH